MSAVDGSEMESTAGEGAGGGMLTRGGGRMLARVNVSSISLDSSASKN